MRPKGNKSVRPLASRSDSSSCDAVVQVGDIALSQTPSIRRSVRALWPRSVAYTKHPGSPSRMLYPLTAQGGFFLSAVPPGGDNHCPFPVPRSGANVPDVFATRTVTSQRNMLCGWRPTLHDMEIALAGGCSAHGGIQDSGRRISPTLWHKDGALKILVGFGELTMKLRLKQLPIGRRNERSGGGLRFRAPVIERNNTAIH